MHTYKDSQVSSVSELSFKSWHVKVGRVQKREMAAKFCPEMEKKNRGPRKKFILYITVTDVCSQRQC